MVGSRWVNAAAQVQRCGSRLITLTMHMEHAEPGWPITEGSAASIDAVRHIFATGLWGDEAAYSR